MGTFKRESTIHNITFSQDDKLHGLELTVESVPMGLLFDMIEVASSFDPDKINVTDLPKVFVLFEYFAEALVKWNLVDKNDEPVPATLDGLKSQDFPFILDLIQIWMGQIASVSGPLDQTSTGGKLLEVPLMPPPINLSQNQAS